MSQASPSELWRGVEIELLKQKWKKYFTGKILDLGCGEGEIAKELFFNKGETFVKLEWGLDNDEAMIKKAEKSKVYKQVILAGAEKIPLKNKTVDLIFCNSVLEHIKAIDKVLPEIQRILKPGGWLIATMPTDQLGEYLGWGRLYGWWFNYKYHHYHLYSLDKWKKLLQKAGLKVVDSYYYLDRPIIKQWHKLLWLNKLGLKIKIKPIKAEILPKGAALAILARKI